MKDFITRNESSFGVSDMGTYLFVASQAGNLSQICFIGSYMRSRDSSCRITPSITFAANDIR